MLRHEVGNITTMRHGLDLEVQPVASQWSFETSAM